MNCRVCNHVEAEHKPLGCVHETFTTETVWDGRSGERTDLIDITVCGCGFFR